MPSESSTAAVDCETRHGVVPASALLDIAHLELICFAHCVVSVWSQL